MKKTAWCVVLIFLACVHLSGCDSSEEDSLFGTYRAIRVNGDPIPIDVYTTLLDGTPVGLDGGSLVLRSDLTFSYRLDMYTLMDGVRDDLMTDLTDGAGEFTITNNTFEFITHDDVRFSGTLQGNIVVVDLNVLVRVVFEKT